MKKSIPSFLSYQEHPTKQIFRKFNLPNHAVARWLNVTVPYACNLLSGYRVSKKRDRQLWALVSELKKAEAAE